MAATPLPTVGAARCVPAILPPTTSSPSRFQAWCGGLRTPSSSVPAMHATASPSWARHTSFRASFFTWSALNVNSPPRIGSRISSDRNDVSPFTWSRLHMSVICTSNPESTCSSSNIDVINSPSCEHRTVNTLCIYRYIDILSWMPHRTHPVLPQ